MRADASTIVGVKDSSGDLTLTYQFMADCGDGVSVSAGRDTLIYATLLYGGKGAVAATANVVPELAVNIYKRYVQGDLRGAFEAQQRLAPLRRAFSLGTLPVVVKEGTSLIGLPAGRCGRTVVPLGEQKREQLRNALVRLMDRATHEHEFRSR